MELSPFLQRWKNFIEKLKLTTLEKQILYNSNFYVEDGILIINLNPSLSLLLTKPSKEQISHSIRSKGLDRISRVDIGCKPEFKLNETIAYYLKDTKGVRQDLVKKAVEDLNVQQILKEFKGSEIIHAEES